MIKSMTGFGRGLAQNDNYSLNVEIKAVNHRFCEIYVRMPKQLNCFEDILKKWVSNRVKRGKIDIFIGLEQVGAKNPILKVDKELAIAYYKAILDLTNTCNISSEVNVSNLISLPGIFTLESAEDDQTQIGELLKDATEAAVNELVSMRVTEGEALYIDLSTHLQIVTNAVEEIRSLSSLVVLEQKQKLEQRLSLILGDTEVDQNRLANELAYFADKVDINEELTRLGSHIEQFNKSLLCTTSVGRKLDFILQEMLREINTIGSKSNNLSINNLVIDGKNELEKIKEQIQNVE